MEDAEFSPNGKFISTFSNSASEGTVRVWDLATGNQLHLFEGARSYTGNDYRIASWAEFSPDSKYLLTITDKGSMRLWDLVNGESVMEYENVAFAKFGKEESTIWVSLSSWALHCWNFAENRVQTAIDSIYLVKQMSDDDAIALTRNGEVWNTKMGQKLYALRTHTKEVEQAQFSLNSEEIRLHYEKGPWIKWDAITGEYRGNRGKRIFRLGRCKKSG